MIVCKRSVVFTLIVLAVFIFMSGLSSAWEEVENVRVEQVGDDVHIYYDLRGDADKYKVTVRGSSDGGRKYKLPMKTVSGDVGKEVRPGSGKKIIWKALKEDYPVFVKWFDATDWILDTVEKFPKSVRFTISGRISNLTLDVMESIIEAIYTKDRSYI